MWWINQSQRRLSGLFEKAFHKPVGMETIGQAWPVTTHLIRAIRRSTDGISASRKTR